jgi:hypothetical protein
MEERLAQGGENRVAGPGEEIAEDKDRDRCRKDPLQPAPAGCG